MAAPSRRGRSLFLLDVFLRYVPAACQRNGAQYRACYKDTLRIAFFVHCWLYVSARNSLLDDLLLPYNVFSKHGPTRSHRETRDCLPVASGNTTHETWPSNNYTALPVATLRTYESIFPDKDNLKKTVYGHFTFINNPLRTVSVLEPGGLGSCSRNFTATVGKTVKYGKCIVAQNGGFFNTTTNECLGNVVSNGKLVQNSKGIQNAQFGIRADGSMVFGYLSEEEVLDTENPFVQLVSGVVWLLRNGEVYIEQSKSVECDKSQDTAVGHDKEGRLVLFHVDGQTNDRGLNLWDVANFLKEQGVYNAINLDGGGSATLIVNGTLANYPSDHCVSEPMWRCPRSVSTVVCVHEPFCDPSDCGGHGQCVSGECHCTGYWTGSSCDVLRCGPSNCSAHGNCTEGGCLCNPGWMGSTCSNACHKGYYGDGCTSQCHCQNNGTCHHVSGRCECLAGFTGPYCEEVCPFGHYGLQCQEVCHCGKQCYCHHVTGSCNVTHEPRLAELLSEVGQCMESVIYSSWWKAVPSDAKIIYLHETSWAILSCTFGALLVISAAFNVRQMWSCRKRRPDWKYSYQQLQPMNGNVDVPDMYESCNFCEPDDDDVGVTHVEAGS
ncbi:N-acetylglucosamine-1-phosphodiester alpha-N-acetylglucosaminidase isoform X2 [Pseudophryne corroboree]|uniref:N-acetylglucosamine-1-phosphodiester alpha-N-acetylglucosaminidase isoform X2 n=1 Tax=Pseudophryne corroboree TaxID=495146 RepID=UPI00308190CC